MKIAVYCNNKSGFKWQVSDSYLFNNKGKKKKETGLMISFDTNQSRARLFLFNVSSCYMIKKCSKMASIIISFIV